MIRKSTFFLNFANPGKGQELRKVMAESKRVVNIFISILWSQQKFTGKFCNLKTETWLSARLQQALGKQALEIVKSQRQRKIKFKPEFKGLSIQLDSRFVTFLQSKNSFDLWFKIGSFGNGIKLFIPCRKHRHFNQLASEGWKLKGSTRLGIKGDSLALDVYFEKKSPALKQEGRQIGLDIGYRKLIMTSEGHLIGSGFKELACKIQRKKQGSLGFQKALTERDEFVNKAVKSLPFSTTKTFVIENLKGLKNGRRFRKEFQAKFQRWTYPGLVKRIKLASERFGVQVEEVNPAFTSQTCSRCGTKDKNSRKGEVFACISCGYESDADVNASVNISKRFRLPEHLDPVKFVPDGK
jgi:putative transposase